MYKFVMAGALALASAIGLSNTVKGDEKAEPAKAQSAGLKNPDVNADSDYKVWVKDAHRNGPWHVVFQYSSSEFSTAKFVADKWRGTPGHLVRVTQFNRVVY